MKLSKLIPMSAVLLATGVALAACGEKEADINIWATAQERPVIEEVVARYNETAEKRITVKISDISEADCGPSVAKNPTQKGAPGLFLTADDHLSMLVDQNVVSKIGGTIAENIRANTASASIEAASIGSDLYAMPITGDNGYFLWYNSEFVTPEMAGSLEALLEGAKAAGKTVLLDIANGWYANTFIQSPQCEGNQSLKWVKTEEGIHYESSWDSDKAAMVSEYIGGLLKPYYDDGTFVIGGNGDISKGFAGNMIAAVSGTWMETELSAIIGDKLAASKLPEYHPEEDKSVGYQMASFVGSKVYCVNKNLGEEVQRIAFDLGQLLIDTKTQLSRFEKRATLPCDKTALEDPRYTEHVSIGAKALLAQSEFGALQSKAAEGRYWDIGKAIGNAYIKGDLGTQPNGAKNTWKTFLTGQVKILEQVQ